MKSVLPEHNHALKFVAVYVEGTNPHVAPINSVVSVNAILR